MRPMRNPTYRWIKAALRQEDDVTEQPASNTDWEHDPRTIRLRAENAALVASCRLIEDGMVLHADGRFVVTTYAVLAVRAALAQAGGEA